MAHRCEVFQSPLPGIHVVATDSTRRFARHWHGSFGLGLIDAGGQRSTSGRGVVEAFAGQLITHNPGEVHDGGPIGNGPRRWRMLEVEPASMARLLGLATADAVEWSAPVVADAGLGRVLCQTLNGLQARACDVGTPATEDPAAGLRFEETVVWVLSGLTRLRSDRTSNRHMDPLRPVLARLRAGGEAPPTLDELAALAGCSRWELVRRFSQCHGLPPLAWLQQLRLDQARAQIAQGQALAEAALSCGFSDQSHFTRQFQRKFGHTPGAWRKASCGKDRARRAISF